MWWWWLCFRFVVGAGVVVVVVRIILQRQAFDCFQILYLVLVSKKLALNFLTAPKGKMFRILRFMS